MEKLLYLWWTLPGILELDSEKKKAAYLRSLHETVYLKDMIERNDLKNSEELMELIRCDSFMSRLLHIKSEQAGKYIQKCKE